MSDVEVIVVANGCTDNTKEYLLNLQQEQKYDSYKDSEEHLVPFDVNGMSTYNEISPFKMIWSDVPWGYTKSTNEGIKISQGEYIILFNNDCVLLAQEKHYWINKLVEPFIDAKMGATGAMMGWNPDIKRNFLIFFCVMIPKARFDELGLLDEWFSPGGGEDTDFCIKLETAGYKLLEVCGSQKSWTDKYMISDYPIYHPGEGTMHDKTLMPEWDTIFKENGNKLIQRYGNAIYLDKIKLLPTLNHALIRTVVDENEYDIIHSEITNNCVLDIGANVGVFSAFCATFQPKKIVAVEPVMAHCITLSSVFDTYPQITIINAAVTSNDDDIVYVSDDTIESHIVSEKTDYKAKTITLHTLLNNFNDDDTIVLKLDCDGAEHDIILNSSIDDIRRFKTIYAEFHDVESQHDSATLIAFIERAGFYVIKSAPYFSWEYDENGNAINYKQLPVMIVKFSRTNNISLIDNDTIGIIMPMYNSEIYITNTINAVLAQSYTNWKLFITNNNSTDNSKQIVESYNDDRIILINNDINSGIGGGRNVAIRELLHHSDIKYVAILDSDDYWYPNHLSDNLKLMQIHNTDMIYSDCKFVDSKQWDTEVAVFGIPYHKNFDASNLRNSNFIYVSFAIVSRTVIETTGFFDETLTAFEDWDYWIRSNIFNNFSCYHNQLKTGDCRVSSISKYSNLDDIYESIIKKHFPPEEKTQLPSNLKVTCSISTRNRYFTTLPLCLTSIINQTRVPDELIIFDDGDHIDLRNEPIYKNIFRMFDMKGIDWKVVYGERKGQVKNHQLTLTEAKHPLIFRCDDDNVLEYNVLETLIKYISTDDKIGAIAGLIIDPKNDSRHNPNASNKIDDIFVGLNEQWFYPNIDFETKEVDHLYSSFLFRKDAAKHGYCMELSPKGFREETIFTYEMKLAGWKILFTPKCLSWHFHSPTGGIRA
jgi:FkbM family methyltransferase